MKQIIPATIEDADALSTLVNSAYRGESSKQGWTTEADLLDGTRVDSDLIAEQIKKDKNTILKYVADDKILACVELTRKGDSLYLGMLTVNPALQGKGIGKEMLKAAERQALTQNCHTVFMTVISARKELIDWYVRHGFTNTGKRKPFHFNDPRFGQPKQQLEFLVLKKKLK